MKKILQTIAIGVLFLATSNLGHAQENISITKYEAINLLFWHFQVSPNPAYTGTNQPFQQYFKDVWPANPAYASINTACELNIMACNKEMFFDGESAITFSDFIQMFYKLKYKDTPAIILSKFATTNSSMCELPYINEAVKTNIIASPVPHKTITQSIVYDLFQRDTILTTYTDMIPSYFEGLELDVANVNTAKYYSMEKVMRIIGQYNGVITQQLGRLKGITDSNEQQKFGEQIKKLSSIVDSFISLQAVLQSNPILYDPNIPDKVKQAAMQYGIREKIGESFYDFSKSPAYRKFNIKTALNKVSGAIIQPNEVFDFGAIIYDNHLREFKMGWLIVKGKEELGVGGGICGSATSVFESAYRSGLEITERRQHSIFYKSLYPMEKIGLDAMVFYPRPNLRFTNNTGHPILLFVNYSKDNESNVQFWGVKHFTNLTLEGPNRVGRSTRWIRTIWYNDGTTSTDETKSTFNKII